MPSKAPCVATALLLLLCLAMLSGVGAQICGAARQDVNIRIVSGTEKIEQYYWTQAQVVDGPSQGRTVWVNDIAFTSADCPDQASCLNPGERCPSSDKCCAGRGTVVCEGADPGNNVYGVCKGDQIVPTSGKLPGGSNIEIDPDSNETADKGATAESKGNAAAGSKPLVTTKPKIPKKTDVRDSLSQVPAGKADEDGSG